MSQYPKANFIKSANELNQFVPDIGSEVAFAGRSNSGKSSAINVIVNRRQFARTSRTPGRTQLVNFFELDESKRLVDLPGYGFAKVSERKKRHWHDLMIDYFETRKSLCGLFLILDIRRQITFFDLQMLNFAEQIALPVHVLLTKADKLKRNKVEKAFLEVKNDLNNIATVQTFSAMTRLGEDNAREKLNELLSFYQKK
jgi:GTP-binding protein